MIRGALRHPVKIYLPAAYDFGNEVTSWSLLGSPRCQVRVLEVMESTGSDLTGTELVEFVMPYSSKLEVAHLDALIVHRGREYDVLGVKNTDYRDTELKVTAKHYGHPKRIV